MNSIKIFVSYSHRNSQWVDDIGKFRLIPWLENSLKRQGVEFWTDRILNEHVGEEYEKNIRDNISNSEIAILLISQEFVSSDFILDKELPWIKEEFIKGKIKIIPILIDHLSKYGKDRISWIFELQTIPNDTKPMIEYFSNDSEWSKIRNHISDTIQNKIEAIHNPSKLGEKPVNPITVTSENQPETKQVHEQKNYAPEQKVQPTQTHEPKKDEKNKEERSNKTTIIIIALVVLIGVCLGLWKSGIFGSDSSTKGTKNADIEQSTQNEQTEESEPFVTIEEGDAVKGNGKGTISFHYGKYSGEIKKFKANGEGRLVFYKKHKLSANDPDKMAEPKDIFDGLFENNEPAYGRWLNADGNQKGSLLTKKTGLKE